MSWQPPPPPPPGKKTEAPADIPDYYRILQVDPQASATIIRYSYRYLAAMYHPDNAESGDAERFRLITDAWKVLSDAGKRAAYDASLGIASMKAAQDAAAAINNAAQNAAASAAKAASAQASNTTTAAPKGSLSWNEIELRLAVLQVLLEARRKRPQTGGASAKMIMDCLNCGMGDLEFVLWYMREKGYISRTDMAFMITVAGVDYLIDQLSRTQPLDAGKQSTIDVNLPASL